MRKKDDLLRQSGEPAPKQSTPTAEADIERYYTRLREKLPPFLLRGYAALNSALLLGVIGVFFVCGLFLTKPTDSVLEKRALAKLPAFSANALFHGELTRDIELWYADTFPLRDRFVSLGAVLEESRGVRLDDVRIIAPSGGAEAQGVPSDTVHTLPEASQAAPAASSDAQSSEDAPAPTSPEASAQAGEVTAISNGTFVYRGMAMSLYGGSAQSALQYADVLNTYHKELPDVQIYNMIIPTAIEFYVPDKYRELTDSQKATIDLIYGALDGGIKKVDAYSKLQAHTDEYLYFRTDHHWTGLGAYYAYTAFCEQAGLLPVSLADCETRRLDNFIGTMYAQSKDTTLLQNPDYVDYYIFPQPYTATLYQKDAPYYGYPHTLWGEYAKSPNSYSVFLHGDFPLIKVETGNHNGRKIMMVKESFGNAFAPFLINNYEEVYIVDQRYFQLSAIDYIKQQGINELLFANNSFAVCTPYHIGCIDRLRHQVFVPPLPSAPAEEEPSEPVEKQKTVGGKSVKPSTSSQSEEVERIALED